MHLSQFIREVNGHLVIHFTDTLYTLVKHSVGKELPATKLQEDIAQKLVARSQATAKTVADPWCVASPTPTSCSRFIVASRQLINVGLVVWWFSH